MNDTQRIILASGSPRRRELLRLITEEYEVLPADVEETIPAELPLREAPEYLACLKAGAVAAAHPGALVIGSDTGVFIDGLMLGKPHSREEGREMLGRLSGRAHQVITGVCLRKGERVVRFSEVTEVRFLPLSDEEIERYLDTGEPFDKAGGYGIQGKGALLVEGLEGDYYNVMGFPVAPIARALEKFRAEEG